MSVMGVLKVLNVCDGVSDDVRVVFRVLFCLV